ncbi:MAG: inositol monophosphatase family protein [Chthoniobacterales bacterium]
MQDFLELAISAAREAGESLRRNFHQPLRVNEATAHDIKLEIDVQTQELITQRLLTEFPSHALYGEEGIVGDQSAEYQWIVDPIDGTVNYFYRIPHFCISIALRQRDEIIVGVIYDPMRDELWATRKDAEASLNGVPFRVSTRTELREAVISVGFSKTDATITAALPLLTDMVRRVRKCRMQGSAALDMAYVACGRFDAYIEQSISLWDVAAGILLVQNAGGTIDLRPRADVKDKYSIIASSGLLSLGSAP